MCELLGNVQIHTKVEGSKSDEHAARGGERGNGWSCGKR